MGYSLGQNGQSWPGLKSPFSNRNRGGFYIEEFRLQTSLSLDRDTSGGDYRAVAQFDLYFRELNEAYLQKGFGSWTLRGGLLRGPGLHSAVGIDVFQLPTVRAPSYGYHWRFLKRLQERSDLGVEVRKVSAHGGLVQRFFLHNANRQSMNLGVPSQDGGDPTQVLGLDYAVDYRFSPFSVFGGNIGAVADREFKQFFGSEEDWKVQNWLRENAVLDFSGYHEFDAGRLHGLSEAMLLFNRAERNPQGEAVKSWGISSFWSFDINRHVTPGLRYEFFDVTDGSRPDDALHLYTLNVNLRPAPSRHPGFRLQTEYHRVYEEGMENLRSNDAFFVQVQQTF